MESDRPADGLGVLLLAPTTRDGEASRTLLASAGIACRLCDDLAHLCVAAADGDVAAIVLPEELVLADGGDALAAALAGQPVWSDLPVIVLSRAGGAESLAVERAVATLGNVSVVERPVRVSTLLSVVRAALRARQRQYEVRDHLARLRRAEARDRFLLALDDAVRPLSDPDEVTATHARMLAEHLGADRCAYADVEPDEDTFNLTGDYNRPGVHSIVGRYRFAEFGAEVLRLMRADEPYVVADIDAHHPAPRDLSAYRHTQIQAVICVPLHKAGRFAAAMAVHQRVPRAWRADEVDLVRRVAARCWESIERARVGRVLRESEARFRQLADAMPQMVWAAGADGELDYYNERCYEQLGMSRDPADGHRWDQFVHPDDLPTAYERWGEAILTGEPYEVEFRLRMAAGGYRWHLGRALPARDAAGRVVRWFGTNTDVHDQKLLLDQNRQLLDSERAARTEAERAGRMKDEFLATLSHELRTPLNAILGWSQILRRTPNDAAGVAQGLDTIERNARAQTRIIEDLLDMSRITAGKVRLDVQPLDLRAVVRAAVESARPTALAKGIELVEELNFTATAAGDASRLQQVFWNLLTNALKFTPRDGRVTVGLRPAGGTAEVTVADTGRGIHRDFLPHVFDRFRQADQGTTRRHGGLGLGLSIVKQLVELHGGTVRADSSGEGRGATFTVALPQAAGRTAARREPAEPAGELDPERAAAPVGLGDASALLGGLRVLVVDDEPDARNLVRRLLEECDAVVTTAGSAAEAIERVANDRPDVLVSDIGMPGADGYALIRWVRALGTDRGGDVPAVALTAYARPEDRDRAIRAGFQVHATKPIEPAALVSVVASLTKRAARA